MDLDLENLNPLAYVQDYIHQADSQVFFFFLLCSIIAAYLNRPLHGSFISKVFIR